MHFIFFYWYLVMTDAEWLAADVCTVDWCVKGGVIKHNLIFVFFHQYSG